MRFHRSLAPGAGLRPSSVLSMQQTLNINSASPSPPTFSEDNSISVWKLLFCRNVDTNANGAIDFNEFIDMMVKRRDCLEDDVAHAFKADLWAMFDESLRLEASATTLIIYMKARVWFGPGTFLTRHDDQLPSLSGVHVLKDFLCSAHLLESFDWRIYSLKHFNKCKFVHQRTTEKILQTMNSWQWGELIVVPSLKCSGPKSQSTVHTTCCGSAPPSPGS